MPNGVAVRQSPRVELPVVSAWSPFFGAKCKGDDQLLSDGRVIPKRNIVSNSFFAIFNLSVARRLDYLAMGGPGVVCM